MRFAGLCASLLLAGCTSRDQPRPPPDSAAVDRPLSPLIATTFGTDVAPGWSLLRANLSASEGGFADAQLSLETSARPAADVSAVILRHRQLLDWSAEPLRVVFKFRWLERENASYLRAGIELVPDPATPSKGLAVHYVGVPPTARARREVTLRQTVASMLTETDGWPKLERQGRALDHVEVELLVSDSAIRVRENGGRELIVRSPPGFSRGRLQVVLRSHSNAPRRRVQLESVLVDRAE
jgi:hypothetical protein